MFRLKCFIEAEEEGVFATLGCWGQPGAQGSGCFPGLRGAEAPGPSWDSDPGLDSRCTETCGE